MQDYSNQLYIFSLKTTPFICLHFIKDKKCIKELNIDVKGQLNIKLFANMKREVSIVEKDGDRLYVSYDKVKYFEKDESSFILSPSNNFSD